MAKDESFQVLKPIILQLEKLGHSFEHVMNISTDKHATERKAIRELFPNANLLLCWYHCFKAFELAIKKPLKIKINNIPNLPFAKQFTNQQKIIINDAIKKGRSHIEISLTSKEVDQSLDIFIEMEQSFSLELLNNLFIKMNWKIQSYFKKSGLIFIQNGHII